MCSQRKYIFSWQNQQSPVEINMAPLFCISEKTCPKKLLGRCSRALPQVKQWFSHDEEMQPLNQGQLLVWALQDYAAGRRMLRKIRWYLLCSSKLCCISVWEGEEELLALCYRGFVWTGWWPDPGTFWVPTGWSASVGIGGLWNVLKMFLRLHWHL